MRAVRDCPTYDLNHRVNIDRVLDAVADDGGMEEGRNQLLTALNGRGAWEVVQLDGDNSAMLAN
jgi:hypothetical protein